MICPALASKAPLKIPGNTNTLLIWFGKSDLPVAITLAPPFFASSGMISGVGFAIAKMIASSAIVDTISAVTIFGAETPINTSLSLMISVNGPVCLSLFVISAISFWAGFIQSSPGHNAPF